MTEIFSNLMKLVVVEKYCDENHFNDCTMVSKINIATVNIIQENYKKTNTD